jgi:Tol biopolymer transport system component
VSPDGQEIAYLSDSGGHGNVWVTRADGSASRQITFEQDPNVSIGVPVWSSTGREIAVIVSRGGVTALWLVRPDGSAFRPIVPNGIAATWSGDDRWLYYSTTRNGPQCIEKVPPGGGEAVTVRCDDAIVTAVSADGAALYFVRYLTSTSGVLDSEVFEATPEDADERSLGRVTGTRVPDTARQLVPILSPDGTALVMSLIDGDTTNIWVLPTTGEPMRAVTDFGERAVLIARRVAWAPDGRSVYAAVADTDADIVLLEGLRP